VWRRTPKVAYLFLFFLACSSSAGCATLLDPDGKGEAKDPIVFGRAVTVLLEDSTRQYPPKVRFLELIQRQTGRRYRIDLESADRAFAVELPPGAYEVGRVQISEGPFMSIADVNATLEVGADPMVYVGTWRFGIDSPRYDRMLLLSSIADNESRAAAEREVVEQYPGLAGTSIATSLLTPASAESRLHEVMPYPYYPRYFRRHWW
jgi:hypothetical protein